MYPWLLFACVKSTPPVLVPTTPILPAPNSPNYAVTEERVEAKDDLVAQTASRLNWDEALSGAAASLGLIEQENAVTIEDARWAAIRAGFPYHVSEVIVGDVLIDQFPQDLAVLLDDRRPEHLGLARVRRGSQDRWVALIASGGWMQGSFSRELELAEELSVEGQGQWHLTAPNGERKAGQLPLEVKLDQPGEWWLEVGQAGQAQSRLPLYVDGGTPVTNFFSGLDYGREPGTPTELVSDTLDLIDEMRRRLGVPLLEEDKMLIGLATYPLSQLLSDQWNQTAGVDRLLAAGFAGGPVYQLACQAPTVTACLDELSWDASSRWALKDAQLRNIGVAVEAGVLEVSMIINLSSM